MEWLSSFLYKTSFNFQLFMNGKDHVDFGIRKTWFEPWFFLLVTRWHISQPTSDFTAVQVPILRTLRVGGFGLAT